MNWITVAIIAETNVEQAAIAAVALAVLIAAVSSYGASQHAREAFLSHADRVEALPTPTTGVLVVAAFRNQLHGERIPTLEGPAR